MQIVYFFKIEKNLTKKTETITKKFFKLDTLNSFYD